jgi:ABC-2 type transport system ATP-binding protein
VGLDPVAKHAVWRRIQALRGEFDTTIFMTTHDMEEADELCDVVAFMHSGRLLAQGPPAELKVRLGQEASLDDVFIHYAGSSISEEGEWTNVARARRTARRLE